MSELYTFSQKSPAVAPPKRVEYEGKVPGSMILQRDLQVGEKVFVKSGIDSWLYGSVKAGAVKSKIFTGVRLREGRTYPMTNVTVLDSWVFYTPVGIVSACRAYAQKANRFFEGAWYSDLNLAPNAVQNQRFNVFVVDEDCHILDSQAGLVKELVREDGYVTVTLFNDSEDIVSISKTPENTILFLYMGRDEPGLHSVDLIDKQLYSAALIGRLVEVNVHATLQSNSSNSRQIVGKVKSVGITPSSDRLRLDLEVGNSSIRIWIDSPVKKDDTWTPAVHLRLL